MIGVAPTEDQRRFIRMESEIGEGVKITLVFIYEETWLQFDFSDGFNLACNLSVITDVDQAIDFIIAKVKNEHTKYKESKNV